MTHGAGSQEVEILSSYMWLQKGYYATPLDIDQPIVSVIVIKL